MVYTLAAQLITSCPDSNAVSLTLPATAVHVSYISDAPRHGLETSDSNDVPYLRR